MTRPAVIRRATFGAIALVGAVAAQIACCPTGFASEQYALNGIFVVVSDGEWARVRQKYSDVPTVHSTWTISSTCTAPNACEGVVVSDQGWTAPLRKDSEAFSVEHVIPDWQRCPDGTAYPGTQLFRFWRVDDRGVVDLSNTSSILTGEDKTLGVSGACGVSDWLVVRMPLSMRRAD
ncbi:hypothetical protein [Mycobacterium sp. 236(2023)]|uniref:hypothetical protein n=1 Tax=Mycobacterium sp. 236(2023) TaxID=3038163 RepID=UPI00241557F4|nr:hypothetical protein [Mycobacterium sp. 236(2023)]MDG4667918.1 hypothetical protein [Mycobacterium sp. 236(2023)]